MIISARFVKPRKFRSCSHCGGMIVTRALRLYGAAEKWDPPYVLWFHPECTESSDPKILKAKGIPV